MKLLFSIILNSILFYYFAKSGAITIFSLDLLSVNAIKTYFIFGIFIGVTNNCISFVLQPFDYIIFTIFYIISIVFFDSIVFGFLDDFIKDILQIKLFGYTYTGWKDFVFMIAIISVVNMFYSFLFLKNKG